MKRTLGALVAAALMIGLVPTGASATSTDAADVLDTPQSSGSAEAPQIGEETIVPDADMTTEGSTSVVAPLAMPRSATTSSVSPYEYTVTQKEANYTTVVLTLPNLVETKAVADKISVKTTMSYGGTVTQDPKPWNFTLSAADVNTFEMDLPTFGTFDTQITFYKGGKVVKTENTTTQVIADEYNLAPIVATFPVVYFSLNLPNITQKSDGTPIPTFVSLQRPDAYNWDNLPANVYWQPNLTKKQVQTQTSFDTKTTKFADYIKQLFEANPDAKFNLYINDAYSKYILRLLVANGIPEDQFTVTLLSDGSGSYSHFNNSFKDLDEEKAQAKYDVMKAGWEAAKTNTKNAGNESLDGAKHYSSSNYAVMLANEYDNIQYWVARKSDTFIAANAPTFLNTYVKTSPKILEKNMNTMLTALSAEQKDGFKALYNFNNQMFSAADKQGKKVMMILGSRTTAEPGFGNFSAYAKFLIKHYGDDYVYYYKGHPATPTKLYPEKQAELDALGITDVESSIPAELILYFYPKIYMAGYSSSTFLSVKKDNPATATGVFGKTKAQAGVDSSLKDLVSRDAFNFYMSKIDAANLTQFPGADHNHGDNNYYMIDFSDSYLADKGNKYDVAVYDFADDLLMYYKRIDDTTYDIVDVNIEFPSVTGVQSTVNTLDRSLKMSWNKVANAQIYEIKYRTKYNADWKTKLVKTNGATFKNLIQGQTFEYMVRPGVSIGGKNFMGSYGSLQTDLVLTKNHSTSLSVAKKTLTVSWVPSKPAYGRMSYTVDYQINGGAWKSKTTTASSLKITGLKALDVYNIKVTPNKKIGENTYVGAAGKVTNRYNRGGNVKSIVPTKTSAVVKVTKLPNATGYEYQYATNKAFTNAKLVSTYKASTTSVTLPKLKRTTTHYVRMRPYKIIKGTKYVGAYSSISTFRTK